MLYRYLNWNTIRINKPTYCRVIVPRLQIIEPRFGIPIIASIPERIHCAYSTCRSSCCENNVTPCNINYRTTLCILQVQNKISCTWSTKKLFQFYSCIFAIFFSKLFNCFYIFFACFYLPRWFTFRISTAYFSFLSIICIDAYPLHPSTCTTP